MLLLNQIKQVFAIHQRPSNNKEKLLPPLPARARRLHVGWRLRLPVALRHSKDRKDEAKKLDNLNVSTTETNHNDHDKIINITINPPANVANNPPNDNGISTTTITFPLVREEPPTVSTAAAVENDTSAAATGHLTIEMAKESDGTASPSTQLRSQALVTSLLLSIANEAVQGLGLLDIEHNPFEMPREAPAPLPALTFNPFEPMDAMARIYVSRREWYDPVAYMDMPLARQRGPLLLVAQDNHHEQVVIKLYLKASMEHSLPNVVRGHHGEKQDDLTGYWKSELMNEITAVKMLGKRGRDVEWPGVPYAVCEVPAAFVFVMRRLPLSLQDRMDNVSRMNHHITLGDMRRYVADIVTQIGKLALCGMFHLDIKPANLMILPNGHLALIDFGHTRHGWGKESGVVGTLTYAAPEVKAFYDVLGPERQPPAFSCVEADLYSVGIIMRFLLEQVDREHDGYEYFEFCANNLIEALTHVDAERRPSISKIQRDEFFTLNLDHLDESTPQYDGWSDLLASTADYIPPALTPMKRDTHCRYQRHSEAAVDEKFQQQQENIASLKNELSQAFRREANLRQQVRRQFYRQHAQSIQEQALSIAHPILDPCEQHPHTAPGVSHNNKPIHFMDTMGPPFLPPPQRGQAPPLFPPGLGLERLGNNETPPQLPPRRIVYNTPASNHQVARSSNDLEDLDIGLRLLPAWQPAAPAAPSRPETGLLPVRLERAQPPPPSPLRSITNGIPASVFAPLSPATQFLDALPFRPQAAAPITPTRPSNAELFYNTPMSNVTPSPNCGAGLR